MKANSALDHTTISGLMFNHQATYACAEKTLVAHCWYRKKDDRLAVCVVYRDTQIMALEPESREELTLWLSNCKLKKVR